MSSRASRLQLDRLCHDYIVSKQHAIPAPLNYRAQSICTSLNHVVCHGIPSDTELKTGDILNIDITVIKDGFHGDTSKMFCIGEVTQNQEILFKPRMIVLRKGLAW